MNSNIHRSILTACILLANFPAAGQQPPPAPLGFIRMLDAVSMGTGHLEFLIDGKPVRPDGYQLGNVTGGIALKPGDYQVCFRRDGVKEGITRVLVAANDTTILIPFAELIPATAAQPARWEIRILKLKQHEVQNTRIASFISVSREPELKVEIRQTTGLWQPLLVKRLAIARAEIQQARGYLPVRCHSQMLRAISVGSSGNFVTVLYDNENGTLCSSNFQDYKYLGPDP